MSSQFVNCIKYLITPIFGNKIIHVSASLTAPVNLCEPETDRILEAEDDLKDIETVINHAI